MANWEELHQLIRELRAEAQEKKAANINNRVQVNDFEIHLLPGVELFEREEFLEIIGPKESLIPLTEDLKAMEMLEPGQYLKLGDYFLLVTDGAVTASREQKCFLLPPDDWLMMGCKFADALYGYDPNPYLFFSSPFNSESLPYGIQLTITDLDQEAEWDGVEDSVS